MTKVLEGQSDIWFDLALSASDPKKINDVQERYERLITAAPAGAVESLQAQAAVGLLNVQAEVYEPLVTEMLGRSGPEEYMDKVSRFLLRLARTSAETYGGSDAVVAAMTSRYHALCAEWWQRKAASGSKPADASRDPR